MTEFTEWGLHRETNTILKAIAWALYLIAFALAALVGVTFAK